MLNRNDRIALRRNRSAVSWLCLTIILLVVWIFNLKHDVNYEKDNHSMLLSEFADYQKTCSEKDRKIDSLIKIINYKPVDTSTNKKVYKPVPVTVIKKDTSDRKVDTNKRIILEDTIK